jgi:ADP-ribose pyrophosphatase
MNKKVEIISQVEVFNKGIFRIIEAHLRYQRYDGKMSDEIVRLSLERGDSAAALVHDSSDDVIVMTEQFRYPAHKKGPAWIKELPAGTVDEGESATDTMAREICEEIGYAITSLRNIATFYVSPGGTSERIHLFYTKVDGTDRVSVGGGLTREGEDIRVVRVPVTEALADLDSGRIVDAKTIIALQWFALHRNAV